MIYFLVENIHFRSYKPNSPFKSCVVFQSDIMNDQIDNISKQSYVINDIIT